MQATIVDLRYKMRKVLQGLDRGESITITHQGKKRAILTPVFSRKTTHVSEHPFFGSASDSKDNVVKQISELRKSRYYDL